MSLYLYGLIRRPEAPDQPRSGVEGATRAPITTDFGAIGFEGAPVRAIPCGPFAAVVGPPPMGNLTGIPKEELVKRLLAHQATLEIIMKQFFVLPFKFGTTVRDPEELGEILKNGESFLLSLEEKVKDSIEIDVVATWDVPRILQEISEEDPEIVTCKKEMAQKNQPQRGVEGEVPFRQNGTVAGDASPYEDRAFIGMLLAKTLKKRAEEWNRKITEALKSRATTNAEHELLNDQMVLNSSFLIPRQGEKEFFDAVEGIDLSFEGKLNFKCIGPLPPYSFATVILKRFDPEEIRGAANVLGLNGQAELTFVKKIYKELSRQCHPDTEPNLSVEKFEKLNRAYKIIADYCEDGPKRLEKEAIEKSVRLDILGKGTMNLNDMSEANQMGINKGRAVSPLVESEPSGFAGGERNDA